MDVTRLRQSFPHLQMMGGVDKLKLMGNLQDIDLVLNQKILPTVRSGGYIPMIDHLVPPEVSWENFIYYRRALNQAVER